MSSLSTFICLHCKQRCKNNPRLKGTQRYCGERCCQQARKNRWEKDRLKNDPSYRSRRYALKTAWYKKYPGDRYQALYRQNHPDYVQNNVRTQLLRNKKRGENASVSKIVKTDALISETLSQKGLYVLYPYKWNESEKIVKTDALIVEIRYWEGFGNVFSARSP